MLLQVIMTSIDEQLPHFFMQSVNERIEKQEYYVFMMGALLVEANFQKDKSICEKRQLKLKIGNAALKGLKIEKLVYTSYNNKKNNKIFPKLAISYRENMSLILELYSKLVKHHGVCENEYLIAANQMKEQYDYINKICDYKGKEEEK